VRRHAALVHAVARRQPGVDPHLADDITQRVFIALVRKAGAFHDSASLLGWLYVAARHEAAYVVRTETRRRLREKRTELMDTLHRSPSETEIPWETLAPVLDAAMADLGETEREAILLRFFAGRSFADVGGAFQITEEAARKRVERAVEKLRQILGRRGIVSTASALGATLGVHASPALAEVTLAAIASEAWVYAAASPGVTLGIFMSSTKTTLAVAGAVILLATALAIRDYSATARAADNRAAAESSLAMLDRARDAARNELSATQRQNAAMKTRVSESRPVPTTPARAYLLDPTYRALAGTAFQARRHLEFQRFYRQLQLSPGQIARFEEIMVQQDQANLDAQVARDAGRDEQEVFRRSGPAWSSAMQSLIGQDGFDQLKVYLRSMALRNFIDGIAARSYENSEPITLAQSDQLLAVALANDPTFQSGIGTDPGKVTWNAVWDPAEKILSPEQLETFETTVEVWLLQKQISLAQKPAANGAR
jgi:RNA polymerase sigma factor (sigma-70 family)